MYSREETIGFQLRTLSLMIRQSRNCKNSSKKPHNIQAWTIGYLFNNKDRDVFQKDIETEFKISRATATKLLQSMEKNGFITRESIEKDKRLKKIILSDEAIKIHLDFLNEVEKTENVLREGFTKTELDTFFEYLKRMQKNIANITEKSNEKK